MDSAAPQNEWLFYSNVQLNCMAKRSYDHHHHHDLRERLFHWKAFDFECYYAFRNADARSKEMSRWFYEHWSTTLIYEMDGWKWKKKTKNQKKKKYSQSNWLSWLTSLTAPQALPPEFGCVGWRVHEYLFGYIILYFLLHFTICQSVFIAVELKWNSLCINGRKEAIS